MLDPLAVIGRQTFLSDYWQQRPVLLRQAWPGFKSPLSADELAGLACEDDIESRIILEKDGSHPWELRHGPFSEDRFAELPSSHWTLLVQDVEKHVDGMEPIMQAFDFIPDWRLDDLMFSYAAAHGSVGPHTDAYDVFLLQIQGQRHWKIDSSQQSSDVLLPHPELQILQDFQADQEWILEPGDILYLPPGIPHHGIALDDCITCSIGFRSPTHHELIQSYSESIIEAIQGRPRIQDAGKQPALNHEIDAETIRSSTELVQAYLQKNKNSDWLGCLLSESKPGFHAQPTEPALTKEAFIVQWQTQGLLYRNKAIKFLFIKLDHAIRFFIDGQAFDWKTADAQAANRICSADKLAFEQCTPQEQAILYDFYQHGFYAL